MSKSRKAFGFVLLTVLLDMVGYGIIIPVLPALIEDVGHMDLSHAAVIGGWMFFAFSMAQFAFAPLIGNLSDRYGRRPLLLLAIFGLGLDYMLSAMAPTLFWLFVGRVLAGVCGSSWLIANAYIADVFEPEERARAYGLIGAAFGIGFVVGPAIGGLLGEFGARVPFWVAAAISLLNFVYGYFVLSETLPPEKRRKLDWKRANPFGVFLVFRRYPSVMPMCSVLFLYYFASAVYPAIWPFWGQVKFGWTEATVGFTLAIFGIVVAGFQGLLTGPAVARWGEAKVGIIGFVCAVIAAVGYGYAESLLVVLLLTFAHGPGGFIQPMMMARMSREVPENAQGELQGGISAITNVALLAGTLSFSQIFAWFMQPTAPIQTPDAAYFISGGILALTGLVYLYCLRQPATVARSGSPL